MKDIQEIIKIKEFYKETLYGKVREAQKTDQTYYDDTFPVQEVKSPHQVYRSGMGVRIIDAPAEQIVTSNPQVFVDMGNKETGLKISKIFNGTWIDILRRQNPNPFKETIKNPLLRGETFIRITANPRWSIDKNYIGLPIVFSIPDPMVIYASPEEDENGIPERVIVFYERQPRDVIVAYPEWENPKNRKEKDTKKVEWFEYWDSETRYCEADEQPVLGGVVANPYGFVPFIRRYSGFGRRSPDGELSNLIVSDIRRSRDLLLEECAMRSNIASIQYLFAHKPLNIITSGELNETNIRENLKMGAYSVNVLQGVPPDFRMDVMKEMEQISETTLQHHRDIIGELNQRHPFIMAGFPFGSSGRQQDMTSVMAMRRYDSIVENAETMWATAFEKAFEICKTLELPLDGISDKDINAEFKCTVKLKAKDPLEEDRRITLGDRLWNSGKGSIDIETFHTEFQGRTKEQSKEIVAKMLADMVTIYNPDIAAVMGLVAAQEGGMERWLELAQQKTKELQGQQGLRQPTTKTGEERIQGEVETETGREMGITGMRGARVSPTNYTRGQ